MIKSGSSSIVDVKFGSQRIAKVYHGSDLAWEKESMPEYMELHIGTPRYSGGKLTDPQGFIIGHNLIPQPASSSSETEYSGNGFTLYALKPQNSKYGWQTMAVNGGTGTNSKYLSKSTSTANPYFGITFPFGVMVKTITIVDASDSSCNIRSGSIKAGNSSSNLSDTLVSSFSRASNYGTNTTLTTTLTVNSSTAYRHIRMVASSNKTGAWGRADGSYYERSLTELMMTVEVRTSEYYAWKKQYGLENNQYIP